jgi:putative heme-binding domain-containing protein
VTIYRGSAFPPEYRGNAFVGDVGGNLVHRKTLEKDGPIYKATRADQGVEFLASRDNWFRPVNFANTPYGTLAVLDMYRETIEHPASIPEPIKKHLDLTSGKDRGRIYEIAPKGLQRRPRPRMSRAAIEELVATLADPDAWRRETAQRLLVERRDRRAIPGLVKLAEARPTPLARAHALWTLDALDALEPAPLLAAMVDPDANVREQGAKLCKGRLATSPDLTEALVRLADDPNAMVRLQAAFSLGEVKGTKAVRALASIARRDPDDRWIKAAVLSATAGRADALLAALGDSDKGGRFLATSAGRAWLGELAFLVGAENVPGRVSILLTESLLPESDQAAARVVLLGIARGLRRSGGSLKDAKIDRAAVQPFFDRAEATARGQGGSRDRVDAIGLVAVGSETRAVEVLPTLLDAREPTAVQLAAIQTLSGLADPRVGPAIVAKWKSLGPSVRREAVEALFARRDRLAALLDGLEARQIAAPDIDPTRQTALLKHPDPAVRRRAEKVLGQSDRPDRAKILESFRPTLALRGDVEHGQAVFKATCATCHVAGNLGIEVGPNLATVANRTPEDILVHILDPNREVAANYVNYTVATDDGRVLTGLIAEETASAVTLKRAEGASDIVPRNRIEQIASNGQSLMPEGLEKGLSPQDFADLIAFLKALPAAGAGPARR